MAHQKSGHAKGGGASQKKRINESGIGQTVVAFEDT
jgi:hypothetical protein